ncbi:hypothetical protein SO802_005633 [Lithocarpus litseifolius]|uniref:Uncharacterized protein n=1 Tax=Lithocarpus litseifolius TaxID=425828 RepID=A0AAW2DMX8_9ROSI
MLWAPVDAPILLLDHAALGSSIGSSFQATLGSNFQATLGSSQNSDPITVHATASSSPNSNPFTSHALGSGFSPITGHAASDSSPSSNPSNGHATLGSGPSSGPTTVHAASHNNPTRHTASSKDPTTAFFNAVFFNAAPSSSSDSEDEAQLAIVVEISNDAKVLIDKEVSAFFQSPDNNLYMLPSIPELWFEALAVMEMGLSGWKWDGTSLLLGYVKWVLWCTEAILESMGANEFTEPDTVVAAERVRLY